MRYLTSILVAMATAMTSGAALAQSNFDAQVNAIFSNATGWFVELIFASVPGTDFPWIVLWLVTAAIVFTLYFRFIQVRAFGHAFSLIRGDYSDPNDTGEVNHFQALATALSGTVGLGNIAGVMLTTFLLIPRFPVSQLMLGWLGVATVSLTALIVLMRLTATKD